MRGTCADPSSYYRFFYLLTPVNSFYPIERPVSGTWQAYSSGILRSPEKGKWSMQGCYDWVDYVFLSSRTLFCMSAHVCLPALLFLQRSYLSQCGGVVILIWESTGCLLAYSLDVSPGDYQIITRQCFLQRKNTQGGCGQKGFFGNNWDKEE